MPKTKEQKSAVMERLTKAFKGAKSVAFANYQGITVAQADELRKKAREAGVEYVVAKKTLLTRAAKDAGLELDARAFQGMIGTAFLPAGRHGAAEDEIAPAKILGDMGKTSPLTLVGGIFDGATVPKEKVIALSKLPGKKELLGMFVGTLNGIPAAFVRALNAIREKQEAGAPVPEAPKVEAAPVAEVPVAEAAPAPSVEAPVEPAAPVEPIA